MLESVFNTVLIAYEQESTRRAVSVVFFVVMSIRDPATKDPCAWRPGITVILIHTLLKVLPNVGFSNVCRHRADFVNKDEVVDRFVVLWVFCVLFGKLDNGSTCHGKYTQLVELESPQAKGLMPQ